MPARKWDSETKRQALSTYAEQGGRAASAATGVPEATIRNWVTRERQRAGEAIERAPTSDVVVIPPRQAEPWPVARDSLVADLGTAAVEALEATRKAIERGELRDARDGSVCLGVLIDKAQLLSGSATSRSESFTAHASSSEVRAEIERLERELGYST